MSATRKPAAAPSGFASCHEFYPCYLGQHRNPTCRRLTFANPFYSLRGDLTMLGEVLTGRRRW